MIDQKKIKELEQVFSSKYDETKDFAYKWIIYTMLDDYKYYIGHIQGLFSGQDPISQIEATFYEKEDLDEMKTQLKKYLSLIHELLSLIYKKDEKRVLQISEDYKEDKKVFYKFFKTQSKKWEEHVFEKNEGDYSHFG